MRIRLGGYPCDFRLIDFNMRQGNRGEGIGPRLPLLIEIGKVVPGKFPRERHNLFAGITRDHQPRQVREMTEQPSVVLFNQQRIGPLSWCLIAECFSYYISRSRETICTVAKCEAINDPDTERWDLRRRTSSSALAVPAL